MKPTSHSGLSGSEGTNHFFLLSTEEENAEAAKARTTLPGTAEEEIGNTLNCQL